jgi:hypothetical protein
MAKKEFNTPKALIEASRLADKVSQRPRRKSTLEAFTGKKKGEKTSSIPTASQQY